MASNYRSDIPINLTPAISAEAHTQPIIAGALQVIQQSTGAVRVSFSPQGGPLSPPQALTTISLESTTAELAQQAVTARSPAIYRRVGDLHTVGEPAQIVVLPVIIADVVVGTVTLAWDCIPDRFAPESLDPLLAVIGFALKDAQNRQAEQQYLKALEYLGSLPAKLNALPGPDDVVNALIADEQLFTNILHTPYLAIALLAENAIGDIRSHGLSTAFIHALQAADVGSCTFLNAHKLLFDQTLVINNVADMPAPSPWPETFAQEGIRAGMMVVLQGRTGLLGYVMVYYDTIYTPAPQEMRLFELLAFQISAALENVRFYTAQEQRTENLEKHVAVRTQELAIALDQAEESNRTKSQLLSTVAHELRRPLSVIKIHATTFLGHYDRLTKDRHLQYLSIINEETDRLNAMLTSLLDISRLEAGRLEIQCARIEPLSVIDALMKEVPAGSRDRALVRMTPAEVAPIFADPERTRQVLANLVDNASKYSPPDSPIEIGARAWDDGVEFWVADRGNGLTPEQIRRVFEPFYQIDGSSPNARGGVGLGLAICKGLIEEMGGRIWCLSAGPGQGSKFAFLLPWFTDKQGTDPESLLPGTRKIG